MEEWLKRKEEEKTAASTATRNSLHHWIKCNSDGAWNKGRQSSGVGWISRNNKGRMLWAGMKRVQSLGSPIEIEAEGIKWECTLSLGYKQMIFETDSLMIVKMIAGTEAIWPKLRPIIQELSHYLSTNAGYGIVYHPREGNKTAYRIAKETFSLQNHVPKLYSIVPDWLKSEFEADLHVVVSNFDG